MDTWFQQVEACSGLSCLPIAHVTLPLGSDLPYNVGPPAQTQTQFFDNTAKQNHLHGDVPWPNNGHLLK